jgi:UDP-N-acetylmuramoyl-L-alanyl-D-glutamate--2,6-diaminopimelate ligase
MSSTGPRRGARVGSEAEMPESSPVGLREVVAVAPGAELRGDVSALVAEAAYDSRDVPHASLFFCVPGGRVDGHGFAGEAVAAGATALVVERWLDVDAPQIRVASVREAMGPMSSVVFGHPASDLRIVGVTGTDGKTTTTYLLESVFRAAGMRPGMIGTIGARIDGEHVDLQRTTPEAPDLHRLLARMRRASVVAVAMEVSSHGLDQHRFGGARCEVALFTNLSRDHLDYHGSMEAYFSAKARLFTPAATVMGVVNADDAWGRRLVREAIVPVTTFGLDSEAELRGTDVDLTPDGLAFRADGLLVRSSLRGRFNVENCLGTLAAAREMGLDDETTRRGIAAVEHVPGRMEVVDAGQDFLVMVDYAHTPDSIRGVLRGARPLTAGRVIVVFGCGGDRDPDKRSLMGEAATSHADLSIVTSDNPRSEDPLAIIEAIVPGAEAGGGEYVVEPDRRAAIRLAVSAAQASDVVVVAGRGHETEQELADGSLPFDDRTVVREELLDRGEPR